MAKVYGMVLAAGMGTRLMPLTRERAKPSVPLMGRPLAAYAMERLAAAGIRDMAMNLYHHAEATQRALEPWRPSGVRLHVVVEETLRGTEGGVAYGYRALLDHHGQFDEDDVLVVMNADILFWPDLDAALALHRRHEALATMVLVPDPRENSDVAVDAGGRVQRILGYVSAHASAGAAPAGDLTQTLFTGVHLLSPRALPALADMGCIIRSAYRRFMREGEAVYGYVDPSRFTDLGNLDRYLGAHLDLLSGRLRWPSLPPAADGVYVDPAAAVDPRASVERSFVAPAAKVVGAVRVDRCVVWPGAEVRQDISCSVVTPTEAVSIPGASQPASARVEPRR